MADEEDMEMRLLRGAADRLRAEKAEDGLAVDVARRWRSLFFVDGLSVTDAWTDVFEPVRRRPLWSRRWRQVQPLEQAEEAVRWFLVHRPDLAGGSSNSKNA
jgi:hypothetical protein